MFTRFLRSFSLPVTYNQIASSKADKISTSAMSSWIVANLVEPPPTKVSISSVAFGLVITVIALLILVCITLVSLHRRNSSPKCAHQVKLEMLPDGSEDPGRLMCTPLSVGDEDPDVIPSKYEPPPTKVSISSVAFGLVITVIALLILVCITLVSLHRRNSSPKCAHQVKLEMLPDGSEDPGRLMCTPLSVGDEDPDVIPSKYGTSGPVALDKVFAFTTSHILETKVSGSLLAHICGSFAKVNPELTLHRFVPHLVKTILGLTSGGDVQKEENLDKELLYYLQILGGIINVSSPCLLEYIPSISQVLDIALYLSNKEGYALASKILINVLSSATQIRPVNSKAYSKSYDLPTSEFLPIREWGKNGNLQDLNLQWYIPGTAEVSAVQGLVSRYLPRELDRIDRFMIDEKSMDKKEMQRCLSVIVAILGCSTLCK
ncbi:proteasome activator complex subunit 4B-like [Diaphorina citri]|uniref:Proteasome activator complex subunit 4B-like n=1 Tax=Diaphorina citri TaxID=121845 RepID=A0A1S3DHY4_DIACI|nr:proteasome activator complex subunit 4B-like [Diaphorina citri]